jgi:hypothetical protein
MLDYIQIIRDVIDAPIQVIIGCPLGIIAALHFASSSTPKIKGARSDSVVRQAREIAVPHSGWVKALGVCLSLGVAGGSFMHLQSPELSALLSSTLPF